MSQEKRLWLKAVKKKKIKSRCVESIIAAAMAQYKGAASQRGGPRQAPHEEAGEAARADGADEAEDC